MKLALILLAVPLFAQNTYRGLTIPTTHPRLFWDSARITRGQTWVASNPITPRSMSEPAEGVMDRCLNYVLTGNTTHGQTAVDWAVSYEIPAGQLTEGAVASDDARWNGEAAMLAFDWCYPLWTSGQRSAFIAKWNGYMHILRAKSWGGPTMVESNYNWGYARNMFLLAVATYEENVTDAQTFLDHTIGTRWESNFWTYANAVPGGRHGVYQEGSNYGVSLGDYPLIPFITGWLMGRDFYAETNYWRDSVYFLIASTLPAETWHEIEADGTTFWEIFPYSDDQRFAEGGYVEGVTSGSRGYGNFMYTMAEKYRTTNVGKYARQWINMVTPTVEPHVKAVDQGTDTLPFTGLPLDFFGMGSKFFYGRSQWGANATVFHLLLGDTSIAVGGHEHADIGGFQIWRNGRWLSRETAGYGNSIVGYNNGASVDVNRQIAHNVIFLNGQGIVTDNGERSGQPVMKRVESKPEHFFAAVDLYPSYHSESGAHNNAAAVAVVREFLFIRPLETMVILDRLETASSGQTKGWIAHTKVNSPTLVDAQNMRFVSGTQELKVTTLVPSSPTRRVITEGSTVGQYRVELETSGTTQGYFLTVMQAHDAGGTDLTIGFTDGAQFEIELTLGSQRCRVEFAKGMTSTGGGIACSTSEMPNDVNSFRSDVQAMIIDDNGPSWTTFSRTRTGRGITSGVVQKK